MSFILECIYSNYFWLRSFSHQFHSKIHFGSMSEFRFPLFNQDLAFWSAFIIVLATVIRATIPSLIPKSL